MLANLIACAKRTMRGLQNSFLPAIEKKDDRPRQADACIRHQHARNLQRRPHACRTVRRA